MSALKQYLDLYREHGQLIDKGSCAAMNAHRREAYELLSNATLPKKGSENYEHTNLEQLLSTDYGLNLGRVPIDVNPAESFRCGVPNMSTALFMLLNDSWAETDNSRQKLPEGVLLGSLRKLGAEHPEILEKYYNRIADRSNALVLLNTMLAQDGLLLYVPDNTVLERPIQLVDILANGMPLMAVRRMLVVLGENAEAQLLICDHTQAKGLEMMNLQTVEIHVGRNARLGLYDLEESTADTRRLSSLYLEQEEGSDVIIDGMTLSNGVTRNEYVTRFAGENASLKLLGMGIEDGRSRLDTFSLVKHDVGRCHTDELFKYVVDDEAVGAFSGRIYVAEGAEKTEAYQSNRNIVGSNEARMFSKPQLEIYNDDVKCSHGTAIGQIDELQMFYMRTRGLSEYEARLLLKQAFMADVIDEVRLEPLRERLRHLVEMRFAGNQAACANCAFNS